MHSREPDLIDARAVVDGYIRFGVGDQAIPEYSRPVIVATVAEALSIARKQEYSTISAIAGICTQPAQDSEALALIAEICRDRLDELSATLNSDVSVSEPATSGRPPTPQYVDRCQGDRHPHSTLVEE